MIKKQLSSKLFNYSDKFNLFLLRLKKNKKYVFNKKYLGINLGCGENTLPEYLGLDGSFLIYLMKNSFVPLFLKRTIYDRTWTSTHKNLNFFLENLSKINVIRHNLSYGIPFADTSVPNIYTSHFLEHLSEKDCIKLLGECYRVLKKGGIFRISLPSIEDEILNMENSIKEYQKGNSKAIQRFITVDIENCDLFSFHKRMYSFKDFSSILKNVGFKEVKSVKFRQGFLPMVQEIETRKGLVIETKK